MSCSIFLGTEYALAAVYADGGICLDILQNQWSPIYDVSAILTSIQVQLLASITPHRPSCAHHSKYHVERHLQVLRGRSDVQSLLSDPNPNSPANSEAARLYSENRCGLELV